MILKTSILRFFMEPPICPDRKVDYEGIRIPTRKSSLVVCLANSLSAALPRLAVF